MKIQENYFYKLDNSKEVKVIWKKYNKANVLEIGIEYPTAIVDLDRLLGVPITEEWLLRFGFIKKNNTPSIELYIKEDFIVRFDPQDKFQFYINGKYINIDYVHQLQNLYFALTNKELTL